MCQRREEEQAIAIHTKALQCGAVWGCGIVPPHAIEERQPAAVQLEGHHMRWRGKLCDCTAPNRADGVLCCAVLQVWAMVQQASAVMQAATGGNLCNMDILTWLVDPNRGDAGFSPHRDRQPDDTPATFRPDGSAKYATMWVPLTPATPENSCLYVIPRCVCTCIQTTVSS